MAGPDLAELGGPVELAEAVGRALEIWAGTLPPSRPSRSSHSEPPSSAFVTPTRSSRLPGCLASMVTAFATLGTRLMAVTYSVGGMDRVSSPTRYSLLSESLPETKGVP